MYIQNRKGQKMSLVCHTPNCPPRGTVLFAHGMAGYKEQPPIEAVKDAANEEAFTVFTADFTNGFGDADGTLDTLSMTSHIEDFEDVLSTVRKHPNFKEPFIIGGHSIGNLAALEVSRADRHVAGIIAVSPNLSGELRMEAFRKYQPRALDNLENRGYLNIKDPLTGKHGRLTKDYAADFLKYDATKYARDYTMPMLFITGLDDIITPPENVRPFVYTASNCALTYHEIYGASHFWHTPEEIGTLKLHVEEWLAAF